VERTAEVMAREKVDDPERVRALGVIDLPTVQRYLNFHYSVTLDLFGSDISSNAATFYTTGLKGRFREDIIKDNHVLTDATYPVLQVEDGKLVAREAPALNALNERLRDDFIKDSMAGIEAWDNAIKELGIDFTLRVA